MTSDELDQGPEAILETVYRGDRVLAARIGVNHQWLTSSHISIKGRFGISARFRSAAIMNDSDPSWSKPLGKGGQRTGVNRWQYYGNTGRISRGSLRRSSMETDSDPRSCRMSRNMF